MKYKSKNKIKIKKGGSRARYPDKKGFQAVYDMLGSENSTLSILTTSSLKGFMLKLDVVAGEDSYRTDANIPINSYILKFVVISERVAYLEDFEGNRKQSETRTDFIEEAKMQQSISLASIEQLQHEICPSVVNLSIFENKDAEVLLDNLINMYDLPELKELTDLFKYLKRQLTGTRGIGILTMPNITGSQTLYTFNNNPRISNEVKINIKAQLAAQVLILFLYLCVIHFDLHSNNSLVFLNPATNNYETRIIDFGRVSDICDFNKTDYINKDNKSRINNKLEEFFEEFKLRIITDNEKRDFVKKVLNYIYKFDLDRHYGTAQMKWIDEIKNNPNNCLKVFQKLDDIIFSGKPSTFTPEKIQKYTNIGVIQDLSNPDNYIQKASLNVSAPDDFSSYHSSQNSNYSSQSLDSQNIALPVEEESQQSEIIDLPSRSSSQIIRTPTLQFGVVVPAELPVTPELASTVASTVASTEATFSIPSNNNLSFENNVFSSSRGPYAKLTKEKPKQSGRFWGGKRSKKYSKKGKKRITKKKRHISR